MTKPVWKLYRRREPGDAHLTCEATFDHEGKACLALCALALQSPPRTWTMRKRWAKTEVEKPAAHEGTEGTTQS